MSNVYITVTIFKQKLIYQQFEHLLWNIMALNFKVRISFIMDLDDYD